MRSSAKSRAEMLGKQNYLPGPNVLTICCIVLAGLDQPSTGMSLQLQAAAVRPALRPQPASKELYSSVAAWLSGRRGAERRACAGVVEAQKVSAGRLARRCGLEGDMCTWMR